MNATLERMTDASVERPDLDEAFAHECKERLGYRQLVAKLDAASIRQKALEVLRAAGIHPFAQESVDRYKKAKDAPSPLALKMISCIFWPLLILALLVPPATAIALGEPERLWLWLIVFPLAFVWGMATVITEDSYKKKWALHPIEQTNDVPEFALQAALDAQTALRAAGLPDRFMVDVAEKHPDPFLVLLVGGEPFYLEVWNEPGFKAKREC